MIGGIQHAFNLGEKKIGNFFLDGYVEWGSGEDQVKIGFEFYGCRFHRCPLNCGIESVQTDEEFIRQKEREAFLEQNLFSLKTIQGCEWKAQKAAILEQERRIKSKITPFLGLEFVTEKQILNAVRVGTFYGICRVDIETPVEIIKKYESMNFPLIFNNVEIPEEFFSPDVREDAIRRGVKFPVKQKTLIWNSKGYIGCTPLLKFYMELGMKISNLQWALQYEKSEPFKDFVSSMVKERINATDLKNGPRGDRAKLVLNSAVGKYKSLKYV